MSIDTRAPAAVEVLRVDLPLLPPTVNHMYRPIGRGGRKALTDEAVSFREHVALAVRGQAVPPAGALVLSLWLDFPNRRRTDGDNRIKALQDAIALACGFDDSRFVEWHVYSAVVRNRPRTLAIVEARP
jgi:Holliday junction resolvase RusA-like endonuclease